MPSLLQHLPSPHTKIQIPNPSGLLPSSKANVK
jgi:hypothetical protein